MDLKQPVSRRRFMVRTSTTWGSLVAMHVGLLLSVTVFQFERVAAVASRQASALKIVVIAGEDAVNIIQQKTAVAPIVEVRDRNDQPVSGVVVNFAIRSGRASFGGARTLSITTDVVGRAVASGLTPTGSGALQISASAAFQGQTAAVTIAQTNVLTAAQAAAIGSSGGAGAGGTATVGGAGGTSGGLGGTTLGLIAGGVGAAAVGAAAALRDSDPPAAANLTGTYAGQLAMSFTTFGANNTTATCIHTRNLGGTLTVTIEQRADGTVAGTAVTTTNQTVVAVSAGCNPLNPAIGSRTTDDWSLPVNGTVQNLQFRGEHSYVGSVFTGGSVDGLRVLSYSGILAGGVLSGTMSLVDTARGSPQGVLLVWDGSTSVPVSLR